MWRLLLRYNFNVAAHEEGTPQNTHVQNDCTSKLNATRQQLPSFPKEAMALTTVSSSLAEMHPTTPSAPLPEGFLKTQSAS